MYSFVKKSYASFASNKTSTLVVFVLAFLIPFITHAATLSPVPSSGTYAVGKTFSVSFVASSPNEAINAVSGNFSYSQDTLEITSVSKAGSLFSLWVQEPKYSNSSGTGSFEGIILNPGYIGRSAKLVSYTFRVKKAGTGTVLVGTSQILANDGNGTDVFSGGGVANFNLTSPTEKPVPVAEIETPVDKVPEKPTTLEILNIEEIPRAENTDLAVSFKISIKNSQKTSKKYEMRIDQGELFIWQDTNNKGIFTVPLLASGKHTLFVKTVDHDSVLTNFVDFNIEAIQSPRVLRYTKHNHVSAQPLVIYGFSDSGAGVKLVLKQKGQEVYTENARIDEHNRFIFIIDKKIPTGLYTGEVFAHNEQGATSAPVVLDNISMKRYAFVEIGKNIIISIPIVIAILILFLIVSTVLILLLVLIRKPVVTPRRGKKKIVEIVKDSFYD